MPTPSPSEAERFLEAVFRDKPKELHVLIWTLKDRTSSWFTSLPKAAQYGVERGKTTDVYVGVGLSPKDFGEHARCKAEDVAAIGGLWADIDVADESRKKPNLPRTEGEALSLLDSLPTRPTLLVHSGGGFQAWWLFKELWIFEDAKDRSRAMGIARRFSETLRNAAKQQGFNIDSTHDLARVLRLPGTFNHKLAAPRAVRIVQGAMDG